jgi:membrane associated rhomboid family serine protease
MRGVRVPGLPSIQSASVKLALALVAGSVLFAMFLREWVLLVPAMVIGQLAVWQPLTYVFVETSPMGVIFGGLIVWSIGGALEQTWGSKRMVLFAIGVTAIAGVLTVGLTLPFEDLRSLPFAGGTVMTSVLWACRSPATYSP